MSVLPPLLDVPYGTAAGVHFDGPELSARDVSYAIAVAWLAARMHPDPNTNDQYRIPDNRLRAALGRNRRDSIAAEEQRYRRLQASSLHFDYPLPAPTVLFRNGLPIRHNLDDALTWTVSPAVVEKFRPASGKMVMLPLAVLANARYRSSVEICMRMLAQHAIGKGGKEVVTWRHDRIGLRMPVDQLISRFHLPRQPWSKLMQKYFEPARDDLWNAAGISFDVSVRRSSTINNPAGKIRDVTLYMQMHIETDVERRIREEALEQPWQSRVAQASPKKRGRPAKPPVPPSPPASIVVPFAPRAPIMFGRIAGPRPAELKDADDTEIEF